MTNKKANGETNDLVKLSFFVEIGKAVVKAKTIDETLQEIMDHIGEIFAPLNWSILLKSPKTGDLRFTKVVGKNSEQLQGLQLPKGEGIAGWIVKTGHSVIVEDVHKDTRFSARVDDFLAFETKSIIGVPLKINEKVFGVIELINKLNGNPFTPFDLKILTTIADFAAIAIEKSYYLQTLKHLANTDPLTGVYNRRAFERIYPRELDMWRRYGKTFSLLMVDIDDFKKINDSFGHPAGDSVLKDLAELLDFCIRKVDYIFRYGGDEFVVLLPSTDKEQAVEARSRSLQRVQYQNSLKPKVTYSISVGIHSIESGNESDLLQSVDTDLYQQKEKKISQNFESIEENLEDMLKDEMSRIRKSGKDSKKED